MLNCQGGLIAAAFEQVEQAGSPTPVLSVHTKNRSGGSLVWLRWMVLKVNDCIGFIRKPDTVAHQMRG